MPAAHDTSSPARRSHSPAGLTLFDPAAPAGAGRHRSWRWRSCARREDAVDAHLLAEAIASDPLMTLKLLAHVAHLRRGRDGSDTETVTAALVMLGIPPFFRAFGPQADGRGAAGRPAARRWPASARVLQPLAPRGALRASASRCTAWTTTRR
ncbi:MAG: hypothetical protein MZW92_55820 [Comamonadaceae bacterium]|nr:hypothetical protein [Comamonadaceae bacterium]